MAEPLLTTNGIRLSLIPLLQATLLAAAVRLFHESLPLAALCLVCAALTMTYALHISFHEVVHHRMFRNVALQRSLEMLISVFLGSSFSVYRLFHWRHHRFTNSLDEPTSTWNDTANGPAPCNFWVYTFGWPRVLLKLNRLLDVERKDGKLGAETERQMRRENAAVLLFLVGLLVWNPLVLAAYLLLIYLGWVGISMLNYFQHPPVQYGSGYTASIYQILYNRILYNNGLHYEHHASFQEPILHLRPSPGKRTLYPDSVPRRMSNRDQDSSSSRNSSAGKTSAGLNTPMGR